MERIKIIGELDLKREQDRRIYETSGLAPTLRAENHDVKILVGITINMDGYSYDKTRQDKPRQDKTRQDKTRQDKTRQDKTRQDKTIIRAVLLLVKYQK